MIKKALTYFFILFFAQLVKAQSNSIYALKIEKYRYTKYLDSTKIYFKKALPLALKNNDSIQLFQIHKHLGDAYEHHQKLDSTLFVYGLCEQFIPQKNLKLLSFLLNDKGFTYSLLHDYEAETQIRLKALKLAEKSKDKVQIANVSVNLGEAYSKLGIYKTAEKYFKQAINFARNEKQEFILHQALRYYGVHQLKNNNLTSAFENLNESNKIVLKGTDSISMAFNWRYLAEYYFKKKQFAKGFELAKKSEKIWKNNAEYRDLSELYLLQANNYLVEKNLKKAYYYYSETEKLLLNDLYFNEKLYSSFARYYNETKNYKTAFAYLLKAKTAIERVKENEKKSKVAQLNIQFETEKKEKLIEYQQQKRVLSELKLNKKNSQLQIVALILFFLFVSVIVIAFFYKKIQNKNKLLFQSNAQLEKTVSQKQILLQELHHRVKNNLTTLKSLLFLQAKAAKNQEVKTILNECQQRIQSMAFIHESLYGEIENNNVDFSVFLNQLLNSLQAAYTSNTKNIDTKIYDNNIKLDFSIAIFLGLILNELVTNSYKYAFVNQNKGEIIIEISKQNNNIQVTYSDNGCGLPNGFTDNSGGFGFKIIRILTQQIHGDIRYAFINGLSTFTITLPDAK